MILLTEEFKNILFYIIFVLSDFMIETVFYDFDGTLGKTKDAVVKTWAKLSGRSEQLIRKTLDPDWRSYAKKLNVKLTPELWHEEYKKHDANLFPGAKEHLERVKRDGYKIGLISSSASLTINDCLKKNDLSTFFDVAVLGDHVKKLKPNPECLEEAARKLESDIGICAFVADSPGDFLAARIIGMRFFGVGWSDYHNPEDIKKIDERIEIAANFEELYQMIKSKRSFYFIC